MIEFCTKKRMAFGILVLISLSVFMLILESVWPTQKKVKEVAIDSGVENKTCRSKKVSIIEECKRCTKPELRALIWYCQDTGYKEVILCDDNKKYTRSCDISPYMDEKNFWIFEAVMFIIGIASYSVVHMRQRKLDKVLIEKINRQIAAGI